ncbi:MAG: hypothetical protein Q9202_000309 [Teloschistes flavicans]
MFLNDASAPSGLTNPGKPWPYQVIPNASERIIVSNLFALDTPETSIEVVVAVELIATIRRLLENVAPSKGVMTQKISAVVVPEKKTDQCLRKTPISSATSHDITNGVPSSESSDRSECNEVEGVLQKDRVLRLCTCWLRQLKKGFQPFAVQIHPAPYCSEDDSKKRGKVRISKCYEQREALARVHKNEAIVCLTDVR